MRKRSIILAVRLWFHGLSTRFSLVIGYTVCMLVGFLLLLLPFSQETPTRLIDVAFTAVSSVSTTGLVSVSPSGSFSFWGELIIAALIQLGGIGYMTLGSVIVVALKHHISRRQQALLSTSFSLPRQFEILQFLRIVLVFTAISELVGAGFLYLFFSQLGIEQALWKAVFHSISAFCTAGFSLFDNSFEGYATHWGINTVIIILSLLGAIGFIVIADAWMRIAKGKSFGLTSKIVLRFTFGLLLTAIGLMYCFNQSLQALAPLDRLLVVIFQVVSAMTTVGFNSFALPDMSSASVFLLVVLMIIGASPSGTGGGVKSTTICVLWVAMVSLIRDRATLRLFNHTLPTPLLRMAVSVLGFYITALAVGGYALMVVDLQDFELLFFEAASALGTVGLSLGATGNLSDAGKFVVMLLMWIGRIGPLTLCIGLFHIHKDASDKPSDADIAL